MDHRVRSCVKEEEGEEKREEMKKKVKKEKIKEKCFGRYGYIDLFHFV